MYLLVWREIKVPKHKLARNGKGFLLSWNHRPCICIVERWSTYSRHIFTPYFRGRQIILSPDIKNLFYRGLETNSHSLPIGTTRYIYIQKIMEVGFLKLLLTEKYFFNHLYIYFQNFLEVQFLTTIWRPVPYLIEKLTLVIARFPFHLEISAKCANNYFILINEEHTPILTDHMFVYKYKQLLY